MSLFSGIFLATCWWLLAWMGHGPLTNAVQTTPTFVNAGAETAVSTGNITFAAPSSPQVGDVWVAMMGAGATTNSYVLTDWTIVTLNSFQRVWYYVYEGTTPNLTTTGGGATSATGGIIAIRGLSRYKPLEASAIDSGTGDTISAPSANAVSPVYMIVVADCVSDDVGRTSSPGGTTPRFEDSTAGTQNAFLNSLGNPQASIAAFTDSTSGAGATGVMTYTRATSTFGWYVSTIIFTPR